MSEIPKDIMETAVNLVVSGGYSRNIAAALLAERKAAEARVSAKVEKETLERAARVIRDNAISDGTHGVRLQPRYDGDIHGLAYADGIDALPRTYKEEGK